MPLDLGRITHLIEQMHRSEDDAGDPIDDGLLLAADGARGLKWVYGGGLISLQTITASGSSQTLDVTTYKTFDITLTDDCVLTISDPPPAAVDARITVILRQGTGAPYTVTWPAGTVWQDSTDGGDDGSPPTLWTDVDAVNVVELVTLDGGTSWGGTPLGADGSGVTLSDETPLVESGAGDPGVGTQASRDDHVHPAASSGGGIGEILISDTHSTPLIFADLLQNEAGSDLLYADT